MKQIMVILCSFLLFLCSCGKSTNSQVETPVANTSVDTSDYAPLEKIPLRKNFTEMIKKLPIGMTRHYITDSVNRRDVYFRGIVLTDEQENDSTSINTRYYIYFDEEIFLSERYIYYKDTYKTIWVEFSEEEELGKLLEFLNK